jgi:hypothetical protein
MGFRSSARNSLVSFSFWHLLFVECYGCVGRDSLVGTATRYGLDGPGIEADSGGRAV